MQMQETPEQKQLLPDAEQLTVGGYFIELIHGIGVMSGLALLWSLEAVRNLCFRILDRSGRKARPPRRVSAFPPGRPRNHKAA